MAIEDENLWMGTMKGLIQYNTLTGSINIHVPRSSKQDFVGRRVYTIAVDHQDNKWVGTYGSGLWRFDGKTWRYFSKADGLGDNWVYDIVFDESDQMWVATWNGVSVFDGINRFKTYTEADGLADKWVYAIALDHDGVFWFGTESGVSRFDLENWTTYTHDDGVGAKIPGDVKNKEGISPTPPGGGVGGYGSSSMAQHHLGESRVNVEGNPNFIIAALVDRQNQKWFGTWGGGLSRFDGSTWTSFSTEDGLAGNYVFSLAMDNDGRIWAGTNGGINWYDGKQWNTINEDDGLLDNNVYSILFDQRGHRWFGTLKGLSVFKGEPPS